MSNLKNTLKKLLPRPVLRAYQRVAYPELYRELHNIDCYLANGRVPFSRGFEPYLHQYVRDRLDNKDVLALFRQNAPLPEGYGFGLHERCVEYPWAFSRLPEDRSGEVLDVGSTLNIPRIISSAPLAGRKICIATLAPEHYCFNRLGVSYMYCDARKLPFREAWFETLVCISTLEHIGLDNTMFTRGKSSVENDPGSFCRAIEEFKRVLKPGGKLLLTMPYGKSVDFTSFQVFNRTLVDQAIAAFAPSSVETTYFFYGKTGWRVSTESECATAEFVGWCMLPPAERPPFPVREDRLAASQSVVCIQMVK